MAFADIVKRAADISSAGNKALDSGASNMEARASVLNAMRNTQPASAPKGSLLSQIIQQAAAQSRQLPKTAPYGSTGFSEFRKASNAPKKSEESKAETKASDAKALEGVFSTDEQTNAPKESSNFEDLLRSLGILPQQAFADTGESTFVPSEKYTTSSGKIGTSSEDAYVADPNSVAMPTGEQMMQLSPEEQREWAAENGRTYAELMATIATLPLGGIGGEAVAGLNAGAKAANAASKAVTGAAKAANTATKANKAAKVAQGIAEASPEAQAYARGAVRALADEGISANGSSAFLNAARSADEALNSKNMIDALLSLDPAYAVPIGAAAANTPFVIAANSNTPENKEKASYISAPESTLGGKYSIAEGNGGETSGTDNAPKTSNGAKGKSSLGKFNQAQSFYNWEDLDALSEKYGYDFSEENNGYSAFRNLALDNPELLADVFGYGDFTEIPGWRSLYARSGVDLSDDATAVDNLSRYYNDNAANIYDWITNNDDSRMGNDQALADAARWYYANYGDPQYGVFDPMQYGNWKLSGGEFDANDFAQFALLSRITNAQDPTKDLNLDQLNDIFGRAGEGYTFGFTPEGYLGLSDGNGGFFYDEGRSNSNNARQYSMQELLNPVIATTPYMEQQNPLMDMYAIDALLTAYNQTLDQKKAAKQ